jgi:acyl-CoA synthetase (AMP-forming)/AMP-acid ligase II
LRRREPTVVQYLSRDRVAFIAAFVAPIAAAALLLPFRADWSNSNVALLLVVVVVAVAAIGVGGCLV